MNICISLATYSITRKCLYILPSFMLEYISCLNSKFITDFTIILHPKSCYPCAFEQDRVIVYSIFNILRFNNNNCLIKSNHE